MSDRLPPPQAEASKPDAPSLYQRVMVHEAQVWSDVTSGNGNAKEYLEAAAEVAGVAIFGRFASRLAAKDVVPAAEEFSQSSGGSSQVSEIFGRLSLFEKRTAAAKGRTDVDSFITGQEPLSGDKVVDMAAYKNRFAPQPLSDPSSTGSAKIYGIDRLKPSGVKNLDPLNVPLLDGVVPKDYLNATSNQAPSLNNITGALKF